MGALRERMEREMQLREFPASTQKLYLTTLTDLTRYHHRAPDTLDGTQVQDYLLYLTRERHLASSSEEPPRPSTGRTIAGSAAVSRKKSLRGARLPTTGRTCGESALAATGQAHGSKAFFTKSPGWPPATRRCPSR